MTRQQRYSINRQLTLTVLLATSISLLVACFAFAVYDFFTLRRAMIEETKTLAEVLGITSAVALAFDDAPAAGEILGALSAVEQVVAASIFDRQGRLFTSYRDPGAGVSALRPPPNREQMHRFEGDYLDLYRPILFEGEQIGSISVRADTHAMTERVQAYAAIVATLLLALAAMAAVISSRLKRRISQPLEDLAAVSEAIADGDLSVRVAALAVDDEIGVLGRTFNAMTESLRDLVGQVRHGIGDVSEVARTLQEAGGSMSLAGRRQQVAVEEAGESIEQVGDSIREVNANVEQLADAAHETSSSILQMDASIGEVGLHMDHLAESIETTSTAAGAVTENIDQVVQSVDSLQGATDSTLVRLHELSVSVRQVKENAEQSHALSEDSSQAAGQGMEAVAETITAMSEISSSFGQFQKSVSRLAEKSHSIDEIIQVISGVAEQTSLLSLNAAIIAAQAGEHGKAFSVVADQVNSLAERTHGSTREIAQLIRAVQEDTAAAVSSVDVASEKVEKGVQRSKVAGEVLQKIIGKSRLSTARVGEIVEAAAAQAGGLERVDQALLEVREIVEKINASAHEQHRATTEIAGAVERIRSLGASVRRSTEEQRRGSRLITNAVTNVAGRIAQIAEATQAQTKSSESIEHALQVFRDVCDEATRRTEEIYAMVSTLSERSAQLEREIGRFKTE
jgi:methyl-accepting chemotaxis protein